MPNADTQVHPAGGADSMVRNSDKEQNMQTTQTKTMHLYQVQHEFSDHPHWYLSDVGGIKHEAFLYVGQREVTFEAPGFEDMRAHRIDALKQEEQELRANFAKRITEIHGRIQSLLAIENTVEA